MKTLRLGTRKSALAQAQAAWVTEQLTTAFPDVSVEKILITTSGDVQTELAAAQSEKGGLKAMFTKEIEEALLSKKIDLAVHSLKDMAAVLPKGLIIGAVPQREDPRDVWISKNNVAFKNISTGTKVGTGAVRRQAQLRKLIPQANVIAIRGNVDTRLRKLAEGEWDGLILALAGLRRLGRQTAVTEALSLEQMVPALGQGCLGIQIRETDDQTRAFLKTLDHEPSHQAALAERAFLKALGGSCQTPIAGYASIIANELKMVGLVIRVDGTEEIRRDLAGSAKDAESIGTQLAKTLLSAGATKILNA